MKWFNRREACHAPSHPLGSFKIDKDAGGRHYVYVMANDVHIDLMRNTCTAGWKFLRTVSTLEDAQDFVAQKMQIRENERLALIKTTVSIVSPSTNTLYDKLAPGSPWSQHLLPPPPPNAADDVHSNEEMRKSHNAETMRSVSNAPSLVANPLTGVVPNHVVAPLKKRWDVWAADYAATGETPGGATYRGSARASTFAEAAYIVSREQYTAYKGQTLAGFERLYKHGDPVTGRPPSCYVTLHPTWGQANDASIRKTTRPHNA